jgi:RNA 3'-terminal phosphate cyclase (ATP)
MTPLVVNGAHGEGGGALFRTALAMSALTQRPTKLHSIRGAMRKPGLNAEDLTFLSALAVSCHADVSGDEVGSNEVTFSPKRHPRALNQRFDISSHEQGSVPGSSLIVLGSLLPVLARAGSTSRVTVLGETFNNNTVSYDPFERATLAVLRSLGLYAFPTLTVAGFGFGGRGEVTLEVEPSALQPLNWDKRGGLVACRGVVSIADLPGEIADRGIDRLHEVCASHGLNGEFEVVPVRSKSPGVFVTVWAEFEKGAGCGSALGQKGVRMEQVVDSAFRGFLEWYSSEATLDAYLADQVLLASALAEGRSEFTTPRVTRRLVTMAWVIKQFMPCHLTIHGQEGYPGQIVIER